MTTSTRRNTQARSTRDVTDQHQDESDSPAAGEVERAVRRDLDGLAKRDPLLAESGLAASVIALARGIDNPRNSLTSKAMAARALREAIDRLLELAPALETHDRIDTLGAAAARKLLGRGTAT